MLTCLCGVLPPGDPLAAAAALLLLSLRGQQWMDGTKFVAQCPIQAGASFTYKFQASRGATICSKAARQGRESAACR